MHFFGSQALFALGHRISICTEICAKLRKIERRRTLKHQSGLNGYVYTYIDSSYNANLERVDVLFRRICYNFEVNKSNQHSIIRYIIYLKRATKFTRRCV